MYTDMNSLFNKLRAKAETQNSTHRDFGNQNLIKLEIGSSYKFRLLWLPAANGYEREYPMINQYVHRIWDDNAVGSKDVKVYCKTSQYDEGETKAGFDCPICKLVSQFYKESQDGSKSSDELYKKFHRMLNGYVPVYIISSPNADDVGTIKILRYTKTFKDFFDLKIFGIQPTYKGNNDQNEQQMIDDDIIGIDAFTYYDPKTDKLVTSGYDFIVSVGSKRVPISGKMVNMPSYTLDFSRKQSSIRETSDFNKESFIKLSDTIDFDKDFYKKSTDEELIEFKNKYITNEDSNDIELDNEVDEIDEVVNNSVTKEKSIKKLNEKLSEKKIESTHKSKDDDLDLDDLLNNNEDSNESSNDEIDIDTNINEKKEDKSSDDDVDIDDLLKDLDV